MDRSIIDELNELAVEYQGSRDESIYHRIRLRLIQLEYEMDLFRYKLKIIDDTELRKYYPEFNDYISRFSHHNAFSAPHLLVPLMLFLLQNHRKRLPAYETAVMFMKESVEYLREGDFAKLKTGSQRFITNTRFAAKELRTYGLIRSDKKFYYKTWELSPFGLMIAANIYLDGYKSLSGFILRDRDRYSAELNNLSILEKYTRIANSLDNFYELLKYGADEQEILHIGRGNVEDFYPEFFRIFSALIDSGTLNPGSDTTIKLIKLLEDFNGDPAFSMLADDIVLRKDIEINLQAVYHIISNHITEN